MRAVYAKVVAKAGELWDHGLNHSEVWDDLNRIRFRTRTGKPWRHAQQTIKLLRSVGGSP